MPKTTGDFLINTNIADYALYMSTCAYTHNRSLWNCNFFPIDCRLIEKQVNCVGKEKPLPYDLDEVVQTFSLLLLILSLLLLNQIAIKLVAVA